MRTSNDHHWQVDSDFDIDVDVPCTGGIETTVWLTEEDLLEMLVAIQKARKAQCGDT